MGEDAGVSVTVRADSAEGFDKGKLQNGVLEVALTSLNRTGCKREQSVV